MKYSLRKIVGRMTQGDHWPHNTKHTITMDNNITTAQAHLNNVQAYSGAKKPDKSYVNEWNRFRRFIEAKRATNSDQVTTGLHFLTRQNVDHYFSTDVAQRKISGDSARRVVSALQYYAGHHEYAGMEVEFKVPSNVVRHAVEAVRVTYNEAMSTNSHEDPHENLRDNKISVNEMRKGMTVALNKREWKDLSVTMTTCKSTYIRNASMRKLCLSRYRVREGYHPSGCQFTHENEDSRLLQIIMRKEDMVKPGSASASNTAKNRLVGGFRHRDWLFCMVGMNAAATFATYHNDQHLNFTTKDWQTKNIITGWGSYEASRQTISGVLKDAEIDFGKITHFRVAGIDEASTYDIAKDKVSTMSKHKSDKYSKAYEGELNITVMRFMAGFGADEGYYVPRAHIGLPVANEEEMTRIFFPRIDIWRNESSSMHGDGGRAARNFLNHVLPYFSTVLAQDGIFWIDKFPDHPHVQMLLNSMPANVNYARWASDKRREVRPLEEQREIQSLRALNASARIGFDLCSANLDDVRTKVRDMEERMIRLETKMDEIKQLIHHPAQNQAIHAPPLLTDAIEPTAEQERQLPVLPAPRRIVQLRSIPRVPDIPNKLPSSLCALLAEHRQLELHLLGACDKKHWKNSVRQAFSRRQYMYNKICARSHLLRADNVSDDERRRNAARAMDEERGDMTLFKYWQFLKGTDETTKTRKRRET